MNGSIKSDLNNPHHSGLVGQTSHFRNDLLFDTSFEVKVVTSEGTSTSAVTIIRGLKDRKDEWTTGRQWYRLANNGKHWGSLNSR